MGYFLHPLCCVALRVVRMYISKAMAQFDPDGSGRDLYLDVPLTVHEALAGARVEVPTPGGSVKVRVPAGTTTGRKLRLKGKGVPAKDGPGDLYLVLRPTPPETDDPAALEAAEALNAFYGASVRSDLRI